MHARTHVNKHTRTRSKRERQRTNDNVNDNSLTDMQPKKKKTNEPHSGNQEPLLFRLLHRTAGKLEIAVRHDRQLGR